MAGSRPRSLGERLSTSALLILLGAPAGVVSLVVFVTGKNLILWARGRRPDLLQVHLFCGRHRSRHRLSDVRQSQVPPVDRRRLTLPGLKNPRLPQPQPRHLNQNLPMRAEAVPVPGPVVTRR